MALVNRLQRVRAKRGWHTRRVYMFEDVIDFGSPVVRIGTLRRLGQRIWRENTGRRDRCPSIVAGKGIWDGQRFVSYCYGRADIIMARQQRTKLILIHEMTHALGPETHGKRFQNRYADLIARYA